MTYLLSGVCHARRGCSGALVAEVLRAHAVAELGLEIGAQPSLEAALDLANALAGDAEAYRQIDQCRRLVVDQPRAEDLEVAVTQGGAEGLQLFAQQDPELGRLDLQVGARAGRRRDQITARPIALV